MGVKKFFASLVRPVVSYSLTGKWHPKDAANTFHQGQRASPTLQRIFRQAYGDEWPEDANPGGYVTVTSLQAIAKYLAIEPGQTLVDLGCGRGGPGLWVARAVGVNLIGIDISDLAVKDAMQRTADFGLEGKVRFQVGDFSATGLPDASCDGAMSIDALQLAMDISGALHEVRRILRPGARFAFTTWEAKKPYMFTIQMAMAKDHRPLLQEAGFEVDVYHEPSDWALCERSVYQGVQAAEDDLIKEMGKDSAMVWIKEAQWRADKLDGERRVLIVAKKL